MPTNCEGTWMVGGTPVSAAYFQGEQVYPCGDEWFDYDPSYTIYIVKDEFIGTEGPIPCSKIQGQGISVSVDANGERVWRADTGTHPTLTLEDKEVWVDGGWSGYTAHFFHSAPTYEWIEDIVALSRRTISNNFAQNVVAENFSVAQAEVIQYQTSGTDPYKKSSWSYAFPTAPNWKGTFHPSWFDGGYVNDCLNRTDYPHDLSGLEVYAWSATTRILGGTTNLDYIPHFRSYGRAGEEAAPFGAYTKLGELERSTSSSFTEGQYYFSGNSLYIKLNDASSWNVEVGDTIHLVGFGGSQHTFFRLEQRTDTSINAQFIFEANGGGTLQTGANTAFYLYKAGG